MEKGLIHLYCGDGKGKTTAAMGLCLRAAGHDRRVGIAQFLKPGNSGELVILSRQKNVRLFPFLSNVKFTFAMNEQEKQQAQDFYRKLLDQIESQAGEFDVLLLDEAVAAVTAGLLDLDVLLSFLHSRPANLEVILTGRNPPQELIDIADYISEIRMIKHPFNKGIGAREGIEW